MGVIASAGVGVAEKVCAFIMLISSAFMQSMSAFVAQNYGAGRLTRTRKALHYGIAVSFTVGIVMFAITFFHGDILAGIFSSDPEVIAAAADYLKAYALSLIHISEPTRQAEISYAVFCLKKKKKQKTKKTFDHDKN